MIITLLRWNRQSVFNLILLLILFKKRLAMDRIFNDPIFGNRSNRLDNFLLFFYFSFRVAVFKIYTTILIVIAIINTLHTWKEAIKIRVKNVLYYLFCYFSIYLENHYYYKICYNIFAVCYPICCWYWTLLCSFSIDSKRHFFHEMISVSRENLFRRTESKLTVF